MQHKVFVGIDPAFRLQGFAICIIDEQKEVAFRVFKSFLQFLDWLVEAPDYCICCIENSNLQDSTFDMRGNKSEVARKSRNVGKNQAASQYTADACRKFLGDASVLEVSPKQKGAKIADNQIIKAIGKQHGLKFLKSRFNQDERDAFKLAVMAMNRH